MVMDLAMLRRRPGRNNPRSGGGAGHAASPIESAGRIIGWFVGDNGFCFTTSGGRITGSVALVGETGILDGNGRLIRTE